MTPHIATGTFTDTAHAEDAREYLLGNEFLEEDIALAPNPLGGDAVIMNITTQTARLAQEAVDVLRNYGAVNIDWYEVKNV